MDLSYSAQLSEQANVSQFNSLARLIQRQYKIRWREKITGLDQIYWDFEIDDELLTLHLEHYCGISLYPAKLTNNYERAKEITQQIEQFLRTNNI